MLHDAVLEFGYSGKDFLRLFIQSGIAEQLESGNPKYAALKTLTFEAANRKWLRYIAANRIGNITVQDYDIVIGPVANDQAIRTLNNYLKG